MHYYLGILKRLRWHQTQSDKNTTNKFQRTSYAPVKLLWHNVPELLIKASHIRSISRPFSKFMIEFLSTVFFGFWAFIYIASFIFLPFQCFSLSIKTASFHSTVWPLFLLKWAYNPFDIFLFLTSLLFWPTLSQNVDQLDRYTWVHTPCMELSTLHPCNHQNPLWSSSCTDYLL